MPICAAARRQWRLCWCRNYVTDTFYCRRSRYLGAYHAHTAQRAGLRGAVQRALTEGLSGEQTLAALERLVQAGPETVPSRLAWLRTTCLSFARGAQPRHWADRTAGFRAQPRRVSDTSGRHSASCIPAPRRRSHADDGTASLAEATTSTTARAAGHGDASPGGGADRRGVVHVR